MQTPAPFEYERATSLDGALAALREHENARVIAGGHSLLPMMKLRLATPSYLVDINDLEDLSYIREEGGELRIGALTRHVDLQRSEELYARYPVFRDAEDVIADPWSETAARSAARCARPTPPRTCPRSAPR
jgi:carbon-monoxide dehydrogenase medium subunit